MGEDAAGETDKEEQDRHERGAEVAHREAQAILEEAQQWAQSRGRGPLQFCCQNTARRDEDLRFTGCGLHVIHG